MSRASAAGRQTATGRTGSRRTGSWSARAAFVGEAAAVALLAYLLAQLAWAAYPPFVDVAPAGRPVVAPASSMSPTSSFNPFVRSRAGAAPSEAVEAPDTALNLKLVGARAEGEGAGTAVIQTPDNQQRLYRVGDEVVQGAVLSAVESDRVIILRDGQPESVRFDQRASLIGSGGGAAAPLDAESAESVVVAADAAPADAGPVSAAALASGIAPFGPAEGGGVVVVPRGDGSAFAAAGFKPYDAVLAVNGTSISEQGALVSALATLGPGSTVAVDVRRDDAPVAVQFVLE